MAWSPGPAPARAYQPELLKQVLDGSINPGKVFDLTTDLDHIADAYIRPGDVVYIEPGEEHWYGATPDRFMAHVAIKEADENGQVVTWLNHVSDQEHGAR